uniref:Uncharacterized protein n=1 Tax=Ditylenchus dipsaci TaxID=166011 RepID=A0A915CX86_9BILA
MQQWQSWEIHYIRQGIEINRRIRGFNAIGHTYRQIAGALFRARLPQIGGTDGELWGRSEEEILDVLLSLRRRALPNLPLIGLEDATFAVPGSLFQAVVRAGVVTIVGPLGQFFADNAFLRFISQGRTSKLIDETIWKPLLGNTAPQNLDYPLTYREIYQKKVMDQRQLSEEARRVFAYRLPFNPHFFIHDDNGFMRQPFRQPEPFRPIPSPLDPFGVRIVLPQRPGYQQKQPRIDLLGPIWDDPNQINQPLDPDMPQGPQFNSFGQGPSHLGFGEPDINSQGSIFQGVVAVVLEEAATFRDGCEAIYRKKLCENICDVL